MKVKELRSQTVKRFPPSLIGKLESTYSKYWWSKSEESLFRKVMSDPFKNIIFTLLSQNTSAENTRRAYLGLIRKFELAPQCLLEANEKEISEAIRPGGLQRVKARRIKEIARYVLSEYNGDLSWVYKEPKEVVREKIMKLPGVGDKTADVLISSIHGHREALVVDTHMRRMAIRLGIAEKNASYQEVQEALTNFFPWESIPKRKEERIVGLFWMLAKHTCTAQRPKCEKCMLSGICDKKIEKSYN
jgi:endonuclease-3